MTKCLVRSDVKVTAVAQCPAGIFAGTTVLTQRGAVPVESIEAGDKVITRDAGLIAVTTVRKTSTDVTPIQILAGSLGHTRPDCDTILPPNTKIHVRDWRAAALFGTQTADIPASRLVDGEFVKLGSRQSVDVYELRFTTQHILYADGIEVLSAEV